MAAVGTGARPRWPRAPPPARGVRARPRCRLRARRVRPGNVRGGCGHEALGVLRAAVGEHDPDGSPAGARVAPRPRLLAPRGLGPQRAALRRRRAAAPAARPSRAPAGGAHPMEPPASTTKHSSAPSLPARTGARTCSRGPPSRRACRVATTATSTLSAWAGRLSIASTCGPVVRAQRPTGPSAALVKLERVCRRRAGRRRIVSLGRRGRPGGAGSSRHFRPRRSNRARAVSRDRPPE
jgi:hypothetical protein